MLVVAQWLWGCSGRRRRPDRGRFGRARWPRIRLVLMIGPIIGAFVVNGAKSWLTVSAPEFWLYFLGALFIAVTLILPAGIVGVLRDQGSLLRTLRDFRKGR
jgi:hypothetical protein